MAPKLIVHLFGAFGYFIFPAIYLGAVLKRCRALAKQQEDDRGGTKTKHKKILSYCDVYIPEPNKSMMIYMSIPAMILMGIAVTIEYYKSHNWRHLTYFLSFFMVGLVLHLEGRRLLPNDSWRRLMCLVWFMQYDAWKDHSLMKKEDYQRMIHMKISDVCFVLGILWIYSVWDPKNFPALLISNIGMIVLAAWMVTVGANSEIGGWVVMDPHKVSGYFQLHILAVVFVCLIVALAFGPPLVGPSDDDDEKSGKRTGSREDEEEATEALIN